MPTPQLPRDSPASMKRSKVQLSIEPTLTPMFTDCLVESPFEMSPSEYPYNEDLEAKAAAAAARVQPAWTDKWQAPADAGPPFLGGAHLAIPLPSMQA
jgi:hypothetical protein